MKIVFTGGVDGFPLRDVTLGEEYELVDRDDEGDIYFIDDAGEKNFAAAGPYNLGVFYICAE